MVDISKISRSIADIDASVSYRYRRFRHRFLRAMSTSMSFFLRYIYIESVTTEIPVVSGYFVILFPTV